MHLLELVLQAILDNVRNRYPLEWSMLLPDGTRKLCKMFETGSNRIFGELTLCVYIASLGSKLSWVRI